MALPRRTPRTRPGNRRLDPQREVVLHYVTDGPARGWFHTHGLAAHGKPELEIRSVPGFLRPAAGEILNALADYLLNDATKPLVAGELIALGASSIRVLEGRADEEAGYDALHYDGCVRLVLVDPPPTGCECEECAKELRSSRRRAHVH